MHPDAATYYQTMRKLANEQRRLFGLKTSSIGRREFRGIYSQNKIKLHLWPKPGLSGKPLGHLRGAYLNVDGDLHVMIDRGLPNDPFLFTLAHELKHHLVDGESSESFCHDHNQQELIEIGAEVFAAELLYPQAEFIADLEAMNVALGKCTQRDLVILKHNSKTSLSYAGLRKRAVFLSYAPPTIATTGWKRIEDDVYGVPFYRQRKSMSSKK